MSDIPKISIKNDDIFNVSDKNNLQQKDLNIEKTHSSITSLDKSRVNQNKCKLESSNKGIKVEENSRKSDNFPLKCNIVCYNVDTIETIKDEAKEEDEEKGEISDVKISKFQLLRARLKRNKNKNTDKLKGDEVIQHRDGTPNEAPGNEDNKEHLEILSNHSKHKDEDVNEKGEKSKPRTAGNRLLHSRLRPDTSHTSNIILPNVKYQLSSEVPEKAIYPKNDPPPVFQPYGTFKSILPETSSTDFLVKDQTELEDSERGGSSELLRAPSEHSKLIKSRENTRYDIVFGNLKNYDSNAVPEDEPIEAPPREPIKIIRAELNDDSDSEIVEDIATEELQEEPQEKVEPSITESDFIEDIFDDLLFAIPPPEKEDPVVEVVKIEESPVENLEEEIPRKKSSIEIIPIIEILINEILKKESPIQKNESPIQKIESPIQKKESPIPKKKSPIPKKESSIKDVVNKEIALEEEILELETEILDDSCNKKCKYKTFCSARREPHLENGSEVKSKTSGKLVLLKECGTRMGSQIPIFKGRKRYKNGIKEKLNVLEICECKPSCRSHSTSIECLLNNGKKNDSLESVLQSYDFISNCSYQSLKSTQYQLVLDLTSENTQTQTCNYTRTDKNVQTKICLPGTLLEKEKLYMYVPRKCNPAKKFLENAKRNVFQRISPKLMVMNKSNCSYGIKPNVEIIYENKFIAAHQHHVQVNSKCEKPSFNVCSNKLPPQKDCQSLFINPKVEVRPVCLRTKDRNLFIKFV